jgi:hypothetical protein
MVSDFAELENVEFEAMTDFFGAAPEDLRTAHAIDAREVAGATCTTSRGIEPAAIFRRAAGLGVGRATSESNLDSTLAYMSGLGRQYVLPVAPQSQPPALASWLEKRGFTRGYAWMKFSRPCAGAQHALIARRLDETAARGARVAVTETGERLPDKPSHSYRNILRAGFEERYLRQNYLSPAPC